MDLQIEKKNPFKLSNNDIPQQTSFWASLKHQLGWKAKGFHVQLANNGKHFTHADMLVLLNHISTDTQIAYIPYIPFEIPQDVHYGEILEDLTKIIESYLPKNCLFIRYDVPWESPWIHEKERYDSYGNWKGNPETHIRELRMNFGTQYHALRKAATDNLPTNTLFLDLNKRQESLLSDMKPKTRYNVRLSSRKGVSVRSVKFDELPKWYELYRQTAQRNKIHVDGLDFFKAVWKAQQTDKETDVELLIAEKENNPLAGMFLTLNNGRATYLYGASSSLQRNLMATYKLQWEAIKKAQTKGCSTYDMFGISPTADPAHPMYGLYKFKKGFGGKIFHRQGCWDFVFDETKYNVYKATEQQMPGYHN